jgi:acetoin utilization deacetylase AcuC-like enzyme
MVADMIRKGPLHIGIILCSFISAATGLNIGAGAIGPLRILYDSSNYLHRDIQYHPEQPGRIDACIKAIESYKTNVKIDLELIDVSPLTSSQELHEPFSEEALNYARTLLCDVHTEELVMSLESKCISSKNRRIKDGKDPCGFIGYLDPDTYLTTESFDVCLRAAACWIKSVDHVKHDLNYFSFALTRPPGHHATKSGPNGFCIFNFAAVATLHAIKCGFKKITILDWDVHYGQGVADIIQNYSSVRYISMHQYPAFPYQGEKRCIRGQHKNILTVPLPADSTWTCGYESALKDHVLPFCSSNEWKPDIIIICAGYDALLSDDLAGCALTANDYGKMTRFLRNHVGNDVKFVFGLEGGYQLNEGLPGGNLADSIIETIKALQ